jgi:hypothetical protein
MKERKKKCIPSHQELAHKKFHGGIDEIDGFAAKFGPTIKRHRQENAILKRICSVWPCAHELLVCKSLAMSLLKLQYKCLDRTSY